ncbi:MAG: MATE family efflux transporter, partial [Opitutaceae bacterium]
MRLIAKEAQATLKLATPIAFGSASMVLMGVVDSLMIGRVGTVPLAASAFTNSVFSLFYFVGLGLLLPVAVLVSRSHGSDRPADCVIWLRHGLALALGAGIAGSLLMGVLALRLDLFQQPPEVIAEVVPFFLLFAVSLVPAMLFQVLRQYAESLAFAWIPMAILFSCVGLNAALNWVLIYGNLGAPSLGLTGAGIATLFSRTLCVLIIMLWLRRKLANREKWPRS